MKSIQFQVKLRGKVRNVKIDDVDKLVKAVGLDKIVGLAARSLMYRSVANDENAMASQVDFDLSDVKYWQGKTRSSNKYPVPASVMEEARIALGLKKKVKDMNPTSAEYSRVVGIATKLHEQRQKALAEIIGSATEENSDEESE